MKPTINFEWDPKKAEVNHRKHGITFNEACQVFHDKTAIVFPDIKHSTTEQRDIIVGRSAQKHILFVSFTERSLRIRIISARKANKKEVQDYENSFKNN